MYGYDTEEPVTFSDEEWAAMMADPVYFGYSCRVGHAIRDDQVMPEGCPTCFGINEAMGDLYEGDPSPEEMAAFDAWADSLRAFPLILCPHCNYEHVGTGAVERCAARR
jgi:hypothetical protein